MDWNIEDVKQKQFLEKHVWIGKTLQADFIKQKVKDLEITVIAETQRLNLQVINNMRFGALQEMQTPQP